MSPPPPGDDFPSFSPGRTHSPQHAARLSVSTSTSASSTPSNQRSPRNSPPITPNEPSGWAAPPPLSSSHPQRPAPSTRRLSAASRRFRSSSNPYSQHGQDGEPSFLQNVIATGTSLAQSALRLYLSLPPIQRIAVILALCIAFTLGLLFLIYSHKIFSALGPFAKTWRETPGGWLLIWFATFGTSFPPVIGYSTCVTVAGFVYGFPAGWPIAASATVMGSTAAFMASRGFLKGYVHRLVGQDKRFIALGQVLRRDGIGVLAMIRLCPLPYSLSNGFLATVGSISPVRFAAATAVTTPKLLVHVFIGSRLALLAESGDKMTGFDKFINYASMAIGGAVGFTVGLLIYRRTMARAAELAREAGGDLEAGDALLDGQNNGVEEGILGAADDRLVDPDELDAAALMDDDDISLWDTEGGYTDNWDDEPAANGKGSGGGVHSHGRNGSGNGMK
ncbi:hypothetical protein QBC35DRAFT_283398 [Podospora australis]|uniref:Golgi apparatus membrane protein TVP38 n=1 Tax=Podospora australis TaxID=1536484 RepID=A0AAN6WQF5_9PEZI|nr:hypothetical protein QBC35DRAFT_283398 [Podospora australis]